MGELAVDGFSFVRVEHYGEFSPKIPVKERGGKSEFSNHQIQVLFTSLGCILAHLHARMKQRKSHDFG